MNCNDFINGLKSNFNTLGINDVCILDNSLIIPIEEEDGMPSYKTAPCLKEV